MKARQKAAEVSFKQRGTSLPETFLSRSEVVRTWNSCLAKGSRETPAGSPFFSLKTAPPDLQQRRMSIPTPPSAADSHVAKGGRP